MTLADRIKHLRKQKGWSQTELAEQIGVHLSHINRLETGKYKPSLGVLKKLAYALDVSLDTLAGEIDEPFAEITIEDKSLAQRLKLMESLEPEDKQAVIRVIDSMLTKQKILNALEEQNQLLTELAK